MSSLLQRNTATIQSLINKINTLPEDTSSSSSENLDDEISTQTVLLSEQEAKIAELAEILADKASGNSGDSPNLCDVSLKAYLPWGDSPSCEIFIYTTFENSKIVTKIIDYHELFNYSSDPQVEVNEVKEANISVLQNSFILVYSSNGYNPVNETTILSNNITIWEYYSYDFGVFLVGEGSTANIEFNQ